MRYYLCDHLGTPNALINQRGDIAWAAQLDAWGQVVKEYNPHNLYQPIRLPGQHQDQDTGLYYNRYRYYEPRLGRYINQDPIGVLGGLNLYRYTDAKPLNKIDPIGLFDFKYYGNWCGPGWTGGHWHSYEKVNKIGYYKPPVSLLDAACEKHDKCYADCRDLHPCSLSSREECMKTCDHQLADRSFALNTPYDTSIARKFLLSVAIKLNPFPPVGDIHESCNAVQTTIP